MCVVVGEIAKVELVLLKNGCIPGVLPKHTKTTVVQSLCFIERTVGDEDFEHRVNKVD